MIVMITLMMMTTKSNIVCASDQGAILRKGQLMALCPFTLIIREVIITTKSSFVLLLRMVISLSSIM